ncbi:MAG TPA: 2Fe-2S iron-sulfur cluster-binding protein [Caldimonas sp.]
MKLTIDQREIEANEGETVLQAATRHGIEIPHFCYHDKLSIAGSCRMCLVKVANLPKLQPACNVVVTPKMVVETQTEQVKQAREDVLQFVLVNHPVDCAICDKAGECRLQDYQHRYGPAQSAMRDPKHHKRKLYDLGPRISLDNERCILCTRCVRFTREISRSSALGVVERGQHSYVECAEPGRFDDAYSDNVIDLCPVGALLSRDFLYECRVWFLEPVRSVCSGCARGCSIQVWRRRKERELHMAGLERPSRAYRITALERPEVNGPWLCNKGFDQHRWMARPRVAQPLVDAQRATPAAALERARQLLAGAARPAVLVSSHASNEELDAFQAAFGERVSAYLHEDCVAQPGEVVEDQLLIRADKNPNRHGVERRFGARAYDPGAGHDVVVVWGEAQALPAFGPAVRAWIHLTPADTVDGGSAAVVIPLSNTFERHGSFDNFEGRRGVFEPVFPKPPLAQHAADVFRELAS